jgi:hypothetical protein
LLNITHPFGGIINVRRRQAANNGHRLWNRLTQAGEKNHPISINCFEMPQILVLAEQVF